MTTRERITVDYVNKFTVGPWGESLPFNLIVSGVNSKNNATWSDNQKKLLKRRLVAVDKDKTLYLLDAAIPLETGSVIKGVISLFVVGEKVISSVTNTSFT